MFTFSLFLARVLHSFPAVGLRDEGLVQICFGILSSDEHRLLDSSILEFDSKMSVFGSDILSTLERIEKDPWGGFSLFWKSKEFSCGIPADDFTSLFFCGGEASSRSLEH